MLGDRKNFWRLAELGQPFVQDVADAFGGEREVSANVQECCGHPGPRVIGWMGRHLTRYPLPSAERDPSRGAISEFDDGEIAWDESGEALFEDAERF